MSEKQMQQEELKRVQTYKGEVRLPLDAYHDLVSSATRADQMRQRYEDVIHTVKRWLSFLRSKEEIDMDNLLEEFNKENPDLTAWIDGQGQVRVNLASGQSDHT